MSGSTAGRRRLLRLLPVVFGVGVALLIAERGGTRDVDLLLVLPEDAPGAEAWDVRVVRGDGAEAARARGFRAPSGRTLVTPVRLPAGSFHVQAWPVGVVEPPRHEGTFSFDREDAVEVELGRRATGRLPGSE